MAFKLCRQYVTAAENHFAELRLKLFQASLVDNSDEKQHDSSSLIQIAATAQVDILSQETNNGTLLSKLIDLYIKEFSSKYSKSGADGVEKNLLLFMDIVSDKSVDQYSVEDRQLYRDTVLKMLKFVHRRLSQGKTIKQLISVEYPENQRLSVKTVNMRLAEVSTLFNWAIENGLASSNPFKSAFIKHKKNEDAQRASVSDVDIKIIIENLPVEKERPSIFFAPLIACFTGMRQSEIAQLDGEDIIEPDDGTWCIDINDRGDKRLKSKNAKRIVPLHPALIKAGLVGLAQERAGKKLFHDVKPYLGKWGHQVSKDFKKYRASIGVDGHGQAFHGIRHSFISKLWAAGVPEAHTAAIVGHQRGERESYTRYAKKTDLKPLLAAIKKVDYGNVKIPQWLHKNI